MIYHRSVFNFMVDYILTCAIMQSVMSKAPNKYTFKVYNNKHQHPDSYDVYFNDEGWYIEHLEIKGQCSADGDPALFANLDQDDISYPVQLSFYMESIWEAYKNGRILSERVQESLDELGKWVDAVEENKPDLSYLFN